MKGARGNIVEGGAKPGRRKRSGLKIQWDVRKEKGERVQNIVRDGGISNSRLQSRMVYFWHICCHGSK